VGRESKFVRGSDDLDAGSLELPHDTVKLPCAPQWRHIRLGSIAITEGAPEAEFRIAGMSSGVYLDPLYLVQTQQRGAFEAMPADWWERIQKDPGQA
jgi:hypothetical protein